MEKIDLIIDALIAFDVMAHEQKILVYIEEAHKALAAARELKALKPMAWMDKEDIGDMRFTSVEPTYENDLVPLYTAPPRKEWVGLTNEELVEIRETHQAHIFNLMFAVEAKIREKNNAV